MRLKTEVASGLLWILFLAVEKEYLARIDSRQKPSVDATRDDGAKRDLASTFDLRPSTFDLDKILNRRFNHKHKKRSWNNPRPFLIIGAMGRLDKVW